MSMQQDPTVHNLIQMAAAGWRLYLLAQHQYMDLPKFTDEEKQNHWKENYEILIRDEYGQPSPIRPSETIEKLQDTVLPFLVAGLASKKTIRQIAGSGSNIANDKIAKCLVTSVVTGWQLYILARYWYNLLPQYSAEEKKTYYSNLAAYFEMPPMAEDVAQQLEKTVLPFLLENQAAERKIQTEEEEEGGPAPLPILYYDFSGALSVQVPIEDIGEMSSLALARSLYSAFKKMNSNGITETTYIKTIKNMIDNGYSNFDHLVCMIIRQYGSRHDKVIANSHLTWLETSKQSPQFHSSTSPAPAENPKQEPGT